MKTYDTWRHGEKSLPQLMGEIEAMTCKNIRLLGMSFKVKTDETISTVRSQSNSTPPVSVQLLYDLD